MFVLRIFRVCAIARHEKRFYRNLYKCLTALDRIERHAVKLGPKDIGDLQHAIRPAMDLLQRARHILEFSKSPLRFLPGAHEVWEKMKKPRD